MAASIVYFTKEISSDSLVKIYKKLVGDNPLKGKVGVKLSTGEQGGNNYLHPEFIKDLIDEVKGTILECNTAYGGSREATIDHWKTIENHGFTKIAKVDIMDEFGEKEIPVENGFHLDKDIIGQNFDEYDQILVLSHFKGHVMGGFGGALKNVAIGIASTHGKAYIHSAGKTISSKDCWTLKTEQDDFLESMADACKAIISYKGAKNMIYINVANRLSVDCDCDSNPAEPEMADIGIFASLDPVAIDQACYDAVINSPDSGKKALIERMNSRHGIRTVEAANEHGLGSREYQIVSID